MKRVSVLMTSSKGSLTKLLCGKVSECMYIMYVFLLSVFDCAGVLSGDVGTLLTGF